MRPVCSVFLDPKLYVSRFSVATGPLRRGVPDFGTGWGSFVSLMILLVKSGQTIQIWTSDLSLSNPMQPERMLCRTVGTEIREGRGRKGAGNHSVSSLSLSWPKQLRAAGAVKET